MNVADLLAEARERCLIGCRPGALLLAMALAGCAVDAAYVEADRATFEAVAPRYSAYLEADPLLTDDARARNKRTVRAWWDRIERAEGAP